MESNISKRKDPIRIYDKLFKKLVFEKLEEIFLRKYPNAKRNELLNYINIHNLITPELRKEHPELYEHIDNINLIDLNTRLLLAYIYIDKKLDELYIPKSKKELIRDIVKYISKKWELTNNEILVENETKELNLKI